MSLESSVSFWDALSFWFITAGVVLTFIGGAASIMFRRYNHRLVVLTEERNRQERAVNEKAIADAGARAAESNKQAAKAEQAAAEANLEVARLKTPRILSPIQQQRLMVKLAVSAGQKFSLAVGEEPEQLNLLGEIKSVLLSAGWIQVPVTGFGDIAIGDAALSFGTGVVVRLAPNATSSARAAADLLANSLNEETVDSKPEPDKRVTDPSILNVLVGSKPMR